MEDLALLTFPGRNEQGSITLPGANPGDVILSVASTTAGALGIDWTGSFMRTVQYFGEVPQPSPAGPLPYIVQTDTRDLSANVFVALVRRKSFDRQA